jgi:hypothetical protein
MAVIKLCIDLMYQTHVSIKAPAKVTAEREPRIDLAKGVVKYGQTQRLLAAFDIARYLAGLTEAAPSEGNLAY